MGKIPHIFEPGCWYFITTTTYFFRPYFKKPENAAIAINILFNLVNRNFTKIDEFIIMPDHVHLILIPQVKTIADIMRDFKKGSARLINQSEGITDRSIWTPNYRDDKIFDEIELESKRKYIWLNPVKKRYCQSPEEFPFSSANLSLRQRFGLSL
jgi:putative transposase